MELDGGKFNGTFELFCTWSSKLKSFLKKKQLCLFDKDLHFGDKDSFESNCFFKNIVELNNYKLK